jgi:hypothetical protein
LNLWGGGFLFSLGQSPTAVGGYFERNKASVMRHLFEKAKNGFRKAFNALKVKCNGY